MVNLKPLSTIFEAIIIFRQFMGRNENRLELKTKQATSKFNQVKYVQIREALCND